MKKLFFVIGVVALIIAKTMIGEAHAQIAHLPINMIYYGWHNSTVDQNIIKANPEFLVDNSPAGPWRGNADIVKFTSAGIKYFEYLDGGYEGTVSRSIPNDLQSNLNYITAISQAGAYGIFLDEVSDYPTSASLNYLKQISDKAHSLGLKVAFNTGVDSWSDSLMQYADYMNSSEVWKNAPLTTSQNKWKDRVWLLTQNVKDANTAANLTKSAWDKGILAAYATTSYVSLPSYLNNYISLLNSYVQTQAVSTTLTPTTTFTPTPAQVLTPTPTVVPATTDKKRWRYWTRMIA